MIYLTKSLHFITGIALIAALLPLPLAFGHGGVQLYNFFTSPVWLISPAVIIAAPVILLFLLVLIDAVTALFTRSRVLSVITCALTGLLLLAVTANGCRFGDTVSTVGLAALAWLCYTGVTLYEVIGNRWSRNRGDG